MVDHVIDNAGGLVPTQDERLAVLIVTLDGQMGELREPVPYDMAEGEIRRIATEAVAGGLPGIDPQNVNLDDFVVQRVPAKDDLPDRVHIRPKTPFGAAQ